MANTKERTLKKPMVINLYGGPGTGKSTTAAALFALLKQEGINAELVTEYAKDRVWDEHFFAFDDQIYIFAKQYHRLHRLIGKVDVIITDAPILLSTFYRAEKSSENFKKLVHECYDSFDNFDVFLRRVKAYNPSGRMQTEDEAKKVDVDLKALLGSKIKWNYEVDADAHAAHKLASDIVFILQQKKVAWDIADDPYDDGK